MNEQDREQFNAWLKKTFDSDAKWDAERNCYKEPSVHMAWMGYQAALSALRPAEPVAIGAAYIKAVEDMSRTEDDVYEAVSELWPNLINDVACDPYDNSLEVYFSNDAPTDLGVTESQAAGIFAMGFMQAWLNFPDSTEQHFTSWGWKEKRHGIFISARHTVNHPRSRPKRAAPPAESAEARALEELVAVRDAVHHCFETGDGAPINELDARGVEAWENARKVLAARSPR